MKTKEELAQLKTEYDALNNKLNELSDDELKHVTGGKSQGSTMAESGTGAGDGTPKDAERCRPLIGRDKTTDPKTGVVIPYTFPLCTDKDHQRKKTACDTCEAKYSTYYA